MVQQSMNLVLGYTDVELDGRFGIVRAQECLLGNFITDLMKEVNFNKLNMSNFILLIQIAQRLSTRIVQFWTRAQYEAIFFRSSFLLVQVWDDDYLIDSLKLVLNLGFL